MYTYMHEFYRLPLPVGPELLFTILPLMALLLLWTIAIKGYALWVAARNEQVGWFVALLVINTVGILELVYLVWFSPNGSNKLNASPSRPPEVSSSPESK